jgi:hypothetical protein
MAEHILEDQPAPGDGPIVAGEPCCLEFSAPGGQLIAMMLVRQVPVEDVVLGIIPAFHAQTGFQGVLCFKTRPLNVAEQVALAAAQASSS